MRRALALLLLLVGAAAASGQQEAGRARVFNWRGGGQLDYSRVDSLSITRLEKFWCQSDSLEVTADLAERRVNERKGTDEFFLTGNVVATEGATPSPGAGEIDNEHRLPSHPSSAHRRAPEVGAAHFA